MGTKGSAKDTIWEKIDDEEIMASLDAEELEASFTPKAKAATNDRESKKVDKPAVPAKVKLIDSTRQQNISIALKRFSQTGLEASTIPDLLLRMDEEKLTQETLLALMSLAPTAEETAMCTGYDGDPALLGDVRIVL
jgi:hypothetical protein